jgi:hypothetical protein
MTNDQAKTSQRKIEANRRNASRSTGPRTPRGKSLASKNRIKHGLLASEIVIEKLGENRDDFVRLRENLIQNHNPVGQTELLLVERMAVLWFRLARVGPAETGELHKGFVAAGNAFLSNMLEQGRIDILTWLTAYVEKENGTRIRTVSAGERMIADQKLALNLQRTSLGIQFLKTQVQHARAEIESLAFLPQSTRNLLVDALGADLLPMLCDENQFRDANRRQSLLASIDDLLTQLGKLYLFRAASDELNEAGIVLSCNIPSNDAADRIRRYETSLERQLYRTMDQLERMQRLRKGE